MLRAYGSWIPTANLVLIPNSIKNNLKDVCINKGLKPACPVGRPVAIVSKTSMDFSPKHKIVVHPQKSVFELIHKEHLPLFAKSFPWPLMHPSF